jgi:signal peptidase I/predicted GNAT family acetyltransferase
MDSNKRYFLSNVYGQSMFPTLKHADKIMIKRIPIHEVKKRDIIVFKGRNYGICHRVVKIMNTAEGLIFYTKGDYSSMAERVRGKEILGKVIGVYRKEKLKLLSLENSLPYYCFINMFSLSEVILKKIVETAYSLTFIRKTLKVFFPLREKYLFIENVGQGEDFKSFYHFSKDDYPAVCEFLARSGNDPVGKLWVLNDKEGRIFLYGPYIKILYRARGIDARLIQEALEYFKNRGVRDPVYAFIPTRKSLLICFEKSGFSSREEINDTPFLKRLI